jgi:hypothetical protein
VATVSTPHQMRDVRRPPAPKRAPGRKPLKVKRRKVVTEAPAFVAAAAEAQAKVVEPAPPPEVDAEGKAVLRYLFVRGEPITVGDPALTVAATAAGYRVGLEEQITARIVGDRKDGVYTGVDLGPDAYPTVQALLALGLVAEVAAPQDGN